MESSLWDDINKVNILVIGDVMLDKYVQGTTDRMSPEAPVPVLSVSEVYTRLGGAANVAQNLKHLGAKVSIVGVVGDDQDGQLIKDNLDAEGIESHIVKDKTRKTTSKQRILGPEGHLLRIDDEDIHEISSSLENDIINQIKKATDITGLVISDYDKGVLTSTLITNIQNWAEEKNIPVYVDPKHRNFWKYKKPRIFKPNLKELKIANDKKYQDVEQCIREAQKIVEAHYFVCTMSELGIASLHNDEYKISTTEIKNIVDVSGAGDTVMAVMVIADQCGMGISETCQLSNRAGGLVCQKRGVVTMTNKQLRNIF